METSADATADGGYLAVLTYADLVIFKRPTNSDDYLSTLVKRIPLNIIETKQCEGAAWSGNDVIITNEQRDILRIVVWRKGEPHS